MNHKQAIIIDTDPQSSQALRMLLELWNYEAYSYSSLDDVPAKHRDAYLFIIDEEALDNNSCLDIAKSLVEKRFAAASDHTCHIIIFVDDLRFCVSESEIGCRYMEKPVNPASLDDELRFLCQSVD